MKSLLALFTLAAVGFFLLFSPWTKPHIPFWAVMALTTGLLAVLSLYLDRSRLRTVYVFKAWHIPAGLASAFLLYAVFWIGHFISTRIFPFADDQINSIYAIRSEQNLWVIALLLAFVIAPAEEIFWRGFLQRRLSHRYGVIFGFILATLGYVLVHVWSFNFMLIAAAAICGGFWGLLFAFTRSLWPAIISHIVWDITIFLLLPIR
jgi:membrane protease YdiL (CAAX protease family)